MKLLDDNQLFELVDQLSLKFFGKKFKHEVKFNARLRTTGGRYLPSERRIELNPKYLLELGKQEIIDIIKHELCHYHLHIEGKGYKHGDKEFKELLVKTGSPRHCNPLPSLQKKHRYEYVCERCGNIYKRVRRINANRYRCGRCQGKIMFLKKGDRL